MTATNPRIREITAAWQACLALFDTVELELSEETKPGVMRMGLELERLIYRTWGNAAGLQGKRRVHPRLHEKEVRAKVLRELGGVKETFEDSALLQSFYGRQRRSVVWKAHDASDFRKLLNRIFHAGEGLVEEFLDLRPKMFALASLDICITADNGTPHGRS